MQAGVVMNKDQLIKALVITELLALFILGWMYFHG